MSEIAIGDATGTNQINAESAVGMHTTGISKIEKRNHVNKAWNHIIFIALNKIARRTRSMQLNAILVESITYKNSST